MNHVIDKRKVMWGVILTFLWMLIFIFIKSSIVIDWNDNYQNLTSLKPILEVVGLLVIVFFNIFYRSNDETTKLSLTATLTISWLALIIFYPFKTDISGGAVGFFALIGGLAVCVLWVHFFSDEIVA